MGGNRRRRRHRISRLLTGLHLVGFPFSRIEFATRSPFREELTFDFSFGSLDWLVELELRNMNQQQQPRGAFFGEFIHFGVRQTFPSCRRRA